VRSLGSRTKTKTHTTVQDRTDTVLEKGFPLTTPPGSHDKEQKDIRRWDSLINASSLFGFDRPARARWWQWSSSSFAVCVRRKRSVQPQPLFLSSTPILWYGPKQYFSLHYFNSKSSRPTTSYSPSRKSRNASCTVVHPAMMAFYGLANSDGYPMAHWGKKLALPLSLSRRQPPWLGPREIVDTAQGGWDHTFVEFKREGLNYSALQDTQIMHMQRRNTLVSRRARLIHYS